VENGPALRHVQRLASEHGVDPVAKAGLERELDEEAKRLVRRSVLRVVEVDAFGLDRESLTACRVLREELAQMPVLDLLVVALEGLPGRTLTKGAGRSDDRSLRGRSRTPAPAEADAGSRCAFGI
jgi:hypothetical protein